ncbi:(Fe-S)-binding protein [Thermus thermamylovorans]|uniref:(Fe-S)-binding protein n=1 Tax=Thermus thermamylovorans TaxID=2509362 RepID=A0A4V2IVD1_9DEIN|nr:(Fe-S)-binding protein [Thermus thermamylovorans]TBH21900.1 (Fe-S)-binding protein [Thermus thermamylovorans]
MLTLPERILFLLLAALSLYFAYTGFRRVYRAIRRGRPEARFDRLPQRVGRAIWLTLTQQTVFKRRPWVSLLHAFVFYGFVSYLLVNLVDLLEGFIPFHPRGGAWNPFNLLADLLTAAILVGILGLMVRRYLTAPQDFTWNPKVPLHERVRRGIPTDSAIVGGFIAFHVGSRLLHKSAALAQGEPDPFQPVASLLASGLAGLSPQGLVLLEHLFWWGALGSILLFLPYFPRSKHIHLFLAPVNLAFGQERPGALQPLDFEREERFGAERLEDLSWKRLLDAYACIMCNRCQEACPAYATGKALSPAAILISERYELNGILRDFASGKESPRPLMDFALNGEALWACTTCLACVEVCPVGNEPMLHILDVRRAKVLMEGEFPQELNNAFRGMERAGNPWGIGQDKRLDWAEGLAVPTVEEKPHPEVLYWVGCAPSYDPRAQRIARSMVEILNASGVDWAVLGRRERCTGDAARRAGNEYLFFQLAAENVETLNGVAPKTILTTCPHCFHTLANEYRDFGGAYRVVHHSQFIAELLRSGKLRVSEEARRVVFHDPCYLGRHNGVYEAPREALKGAGLELLEPPRNRERGFCCGAGGAQFWKEEEPGAMRVSQNRYRELKGTGAEVIATGCPFCMAMMNVEVAQDEAPPEVLDLAELVARGLKA